MPVNQNPQPEARIMTTSTQPNLPEEAGTLRHLMLIVLLMGTVLSSPARAADANDSFQSNALFNPTPAQLRAEARGRVMICDGLDNAVVDRVLDEQFDRIEHMMFIRTRQNTSDGDDDDIVEDDGC
jgi:hypothetical protein